MSSKDIAVSVRGLSKVYKIAHNTERATTLGEALLQRVKKPLQTASSENFWALKDVSFDINKGDVVGIIGRNGAGKSTLLKILSQITEPTQGAIDLYGRVGSLLEVGTGFHPELTGRENIFLNGAILGMRRKEIERQFDAIVDFAEVAKFLDTPVKRYSSGMYVRLAFAVAAHLNPEILIVDEVLAVGDAEFQKKCLGKMQDVSAQQGKTVIFVSHNMGAVRGLCSSAIWLKNGEVVDFDATPQVVSAYLHSTMESSRGFIDLRQEPRSPGVGNRFKISGLTLNDGSPLMHGQTLSFAIDSNRWVRWKKP
jgi:lipopolysaccharide transport system ATP-binding protein